MSAARSAEDRGTRDSQETRVAEYYDVNTRKFSRRAQAGAGGTIHRAVWAPGVANREDAFHFAEREVQKCLERFGSRPRIDLVDLGCGTGATLSWLAAKTPNLHALGVTLSADQVARANARATSDGLGPRLKFAQASFVSVPRDAAAFDVAIAVESFLHGADADAFFAEAARLVRPGGTLLLIDDLLSPAASRTDADIEDFIRGWRVGTLLPVEGAVKRARDAGFELATSQDLSSWLELGRARDRFIAALVALGARRLIDRPEWGALVGGHALQRGLARGLLQYWELQFTRR